MKHSYRAPEARVIAPSDDILTESPALPELDWSDGDDHTIV